MKKLKHVKLFENFNSNDFNQLLGKEIKSIDIEITLDQFEIILKTDGGDYQIEGAHAGSIDIPSHEISFGEIIHVDDDYETGYDLDDFDFVSRVFPGIKITNIKKEKMFLFFELANEVLMRYKIPVKMYVNGENIQLKKIK